MERASAVDRSEGAAPALGYRQRGLWSDALRRLRRNRLALLSLIILAALTAVVILGNTVDFVQRYSPREQDFTAIHQGPSADHFFGTDQLGRDTWARVLQGMSISLQVGFGVAIIVLIIGMAIGGMAALGGSFLDNVMMRFTDMAYAFPDLLFIILLRSALEGRDWPILGEPVAQMIIAISFVGWVTLARLVRGQMLSLKEQDFVIAARAIGAPAWRVVLVHMMPNVLGPVIVAVVFVVPLAIFSESVLGFIGIGVPAPTASLGVLVSAGYTYIKVNVWMAVFPAASIAVLMLAFTFLGDGLRDALDPRTRQ